MQHQALTDAKLVERLINRVALERTCTADVLEDLAEVDARKIYVTEGYTSLCEYGVKALGYSEDESYPRVAAARLTRRFPLALQMLRDGRATLSTLKTIGMHLNEDNATERLEAAAGLTISKVKELVASWAPKPDVPTTVKFVATTEPPRLFERTEPTPPPALVIEPTRPAPLPKPLSPGKRVITFTLDEDEYTELMRLRALDRHATPDGDIKKVIVKAVRDRLAKVEARKFGKLKTDRPTEPPSAETDKRTLTQAQKREVAARDGHQCCYVSPSGRRCESTAWLEHDHIDGWSLTHQTTAARTQLLCRTHNQAKGSAPGFVT